MVYSLLNRCKRDVGGIWDEYQLLQDMFANYSSIGRPTLNPLDVIHVKLGAALQQIIEMVLIVIALRKDSLASNYCLYAFLTVSDSGRHQRTSALLCSMNNVKALLCWVF